MPIKLEAESITDALQGVYEGKIAFRHSENLLERFGRWFSGPMLTLDVRCDYRFWAKAQID